MQTGKTRMIFGTALAAFALAACSQTTTGATGATEIAFCDVWQNSLPSRSRDDTTKTQVDIGHAYDVFEAVCEREA